MESKDVKQVESNSALNRLDRKRQSTVHQNSHGNFWLKHISIVRNLIQIELPLKIYPF
uniref:Uncharacterized protein n=1 Tax=Heterorhabditis bacteriophora TaxID=37862 RepID=A0A1I7WYB9_HETBA